MKKKIGLFVVSLVCLLVGFFLHEPYRTLELEEAGSEYGASIEYTDMDQAMADENSSEDLTYEKVVVIDPGHQLKGDLSKEPIGPGASQTKAKVTYGNCGVKTGTPEYEINLLISLKLQAELESRGYTVIMCRTENDVNLSNSERAMIANDANADAFIRVHANGSEYPSVHGAMGMCQTAENPYNADQYEASRLLSDCVLDGVVNKTSCKKQGVFEDDTMSGINWSQVPVTVIEVGYLSNADEEALLVTDEYQELIAQGIADGVDAYFNAMQ